jgi:hypothetical protein
MAMVPSRVTSKGHSQLGSLAGAGVVTTRISEALENLPSSSTPNTRNSYLFSGCRLPTRPAMMPDLVSTFSHFSMGFQVLNTCPEG